MRAMSAPETTPPAVPAGEVRRRSPRIAAQVPIDVAFEGVSSDGRTAQVSRHGGVIVCALNCSEEDLLEVSNATTRESVRCRVVWCGRELIHGERKLAIAMLEDRPNFWGIDFGGAGQRAPHA